MQSEPMVVYRPLELKPEGEAKLPNKQIFVRPMMTPRASIEEDIPQITLLKSTSVADDLPATLQNFVLLDPEQLRRAELTE